MPRPTGSIKATPSYRFHKSSGQAVVTINGRDHYLGPHGSRASRAEYDRILGEWLASGRRPVVTSAVTIYEVIAAFWEFVEGYYVAPVAGSDGNPELNDDGSPRLQPTGEAENYRYALRPLKRLYGNTAAAEFGPLALQAVMAEMVKLGWCRTVVNRQAGRIKQMFRWAVANEIVPAAVYEALKALPGLRKGRSTAREPLPVKPVSEAWVRATARFLSAQLQAVVELQLLTGMRPGEALALRGCDLEMGDALWIYRPAHHKTSYHGHGRVIHLGRRAQEVLKQHLKRNPLEYLFSPADAEKERQRLRREARETPLSCGNVPGSNKKRKRSRAPQDRYTVKAYRRAIARACDRAFPLPAPLARMRGESSSNWKARLTEEQKQELARWHEKHGWHPHQLRHTAATKLRKQYGIEAARIILGHRSSAVTEIYAEVDRSTAEKIMSEVG